MNPRDLSDLDLFIAASAGEPGARAELARRGIDPAEKATVL